MLTKEQQRALRIGDIVRLTGRTPMTGVIVRFSDAVRPGEFAIKDAPRSCCKLRCDPRDPRLELVGSDGEVQP